MSEYSWKIRLVNIDTIIGYVKRLEKENGWMS